MRLAPLIALTIALLVPASSALTQDAPGINPSFGPPKNVLELFTSQGCDTCPPADQVLAEFAERPDVIAITLPVDIWDYLGWKDTLATDKNSERQKAYAKARGDGAIYTPQVVVNGMIGVNGSDPAAIEEAIKTTDEALKGGRVPIRFWHERNSIKIEAGDAPPGFDVQGSDDLVRRRAEVGRRFPCSAATTRARRSPTRTSCARCCPSARGTARR